MSQKFSQPFSKTLGMHKNASGTHLEDSNKDLAEVGRRLLYRGSDIAAAFLATLAPDNGTRVHPVFLSDRSLHEMEQLGNFRSLAKLYEMAFLIGISNE